MILLDVNVLLYAHNEESPDHEATRRWLDQIWVNDETVGLPWVSIWGFVRLATNPRVWPNPRTPAQACAAMVKLLAQPNVVAVEPGARHLALLERLMTAHGVAGPRTTDAVLAALAIEHGATLATSDRHFTAFEGLKCVNPLA